METLTIKELAPYFPYGLKGISSEEIFGIEEVKGFNTYGNNNAICLITNIDEIDLPLFCPILYPLSWLTKEITHNGETLVPVERLIKEDYYGAFELKRMYDENFINPYTLPYCITYKLIEWKFDVFGLIEKNLAIPVTEEFNPYK